MAFHEFALLNHSLTLEDSKMLPWRTSMRRNIYPKRYFNFLIQSVQKMNPPRVLSFIWPIEASFHLRRFKASASEELNTTKQLPKMFLNLSYCRVRLETTY